MAKIAGVVIDSWKLPTFKKHLDTAKRTYTEHPGTSIVTLKVEYEWVADLQPIIEAAEKECSKCKPKGKG